MTTLEHLKMFLEDNPPKKMPFWPGARYTGRVGLRTSREVLDAGASPLHLGVDRAGGDQLKMPFYGVLEWKKVHGPAGSILRLSPYGMDLEIQVFHTAHKDRFVDELEGCFSKGDVLPVQPSNLGLSTGVHTHTEVLLPYELDLLHWIKEGTVPFIRAGVVDEWYVKHHADKHDLNEKDLLERLRTQVREWDITEAAPRYVVRQTLPPYRAPVWAGERPTTIHVDSRWLLKI